MTRKSRFILFAAALVAALPVAAFSAVPAAAQEDQLYYYCSAYSRDGGYFLVTSVFQYRRFGGSELRNRFRDRITTYRAYRPDSQTNCVNFDTRDSASAHRDGYIRDYRNMSARIEDFYFSG